MLKDIAILAAIIVASPAIGILASILSAFMCVAVLAIIVASPAIGIMVAIISAFMCVRAVLAMLVKDLADETIEKIKGDRYDD